MLAELQDTSSLNVLSYSYIGANNRELITSVGGTITEIRYHYPVGDGDKHFVDVYQNGKLAWRDFNISAVTFFKN